MSLALPPLELCAGGLPLAYDDDYPPESAIGCLLPSTDWFDPDDPLRSYERAGAELRDAIVALLPPGWSFAGRRALDFGCGAGRVLRHFAAEAETAELWGCDLNRAAIEWIEENLVPPFHALANDAEPPLPFPDGHFDLIWAYSVFTHLGESWSRWLCELHRLLSADGVLIATVATGEMATTFTGRRFDGDRVGMLVRSPGAAWNVGGPFVVHSQWWIQAHWGRAFEVVHFGPIGTSDPAPLRQTAAVMRRRDVSVRPEDLEAPEAEKREIEARREQLRDLRLVAEIEAGAHEHRRADLLVERERAWAEYAEAAQRRAG